MPARIARVHSQKLPTLRLTVLPSGCHNPGRAPLASTLASSKEAVQNSRGLVFLLAKGVRIATPWPSASLTDPTSFFGEREILNFLAAQGEQKYYPTGSNFNVTIRVLFLDLSTRSMSASLALNPEINF